MFTEDELKSIIEESKTKSLSDSVTEKINNFGMMKFLDDTVKDLTIVQEELPEVFEDKELCHDLSELIESICNTIATKQLKMIGRIRKVGMKEVRFKSSELKNLEKAKKIEQKIKELEEEKRELIGG